MEKFRLLIINEKFNTVRLSYNDVISYNVSPEEIDIYTENEKTYHHTLFAGEKIITIENNSNFDFDIYYRDKDIVKIEDTLKELASDLDVYADTLNETLEDFRKLINKILEKEQKQ